MICGETPRCREASGFRRDGQDARESSDWPEFTIGRLRTNR
jgi:hypothetical protein